MNSEDVTETEWVTAQVPKDLARAFREMAQRNERSVSAELRLAMRARLDAPDAAERAA